MRLHRCTPHDKKRGTSGRRTVGQRDDDRHSFLMDTLRRCSGGDAYCESECGEAQNASHDRLSGKCVHPRHSHTSASPCQIVVQVKPPSELTSRYTNSTWHAVPPPPEPLPSPFVSPVPQPVLSVSVYEYGSYVS